MKGRCILGCAILVLIAHRMPQAEAGSWVFVSLLKARQIVTFERDAATGELVRRRSTACPAEPAGMTAAPDRKTLYVSLRSTGQLASFRINSQTGELGLLNVVEGGADPAYLLVDPSGQYLLSAYYVDNKVCVHKLSSDGSVSAAPLQTVKTAARAHGIAYDSARHAVYVTHTGANQIFQFRFDQRSGRLQPAEPESVHTPAEDHPRHIVLHPSHRWAYVSNEAGDSLGVFTVQPPTGSLQRLQTVPSIPGDFPQEKNSTARCEMTPDGRFVYVANRGHNSLAGYSVDQETGRATSLGQTPTEAIPRSFTISPDGRHLYAAGQGSGRVAAYQLGKLGELKRFATYDSGPVSWWILSIDTP